MADWLGRALGAARSAGRGRRPPVPGTVLLAGTGDHLILKGADSFGYTPEPPTMPTAPRSMSSFKSVGELWPGKAQSASC